MFQDLYGFITKGRRKGAKKQGMQMSHIYQPAMLITLLQNGGCATVEEVARAFLGRDKSQLEYYKHITKRMPGRVLKSHDIVEKEGDVYRLVGFETLSEEEKNLLINACQVRLDKYLLDHGERLYGKQGHISGPLRYRVLSRAKGRCALCGVSAEAEALDLDHIVPRSKGGSDDESNLQVLCAPCNRQKGNRDDTDFRKVLQAYGHRERGCVFCHIKEKKIIDENALAIAVRDKYPVTESHTLIIPRRHTESYFDLGSSEVNACHLLLEEQKEYMAKKDSAIEGFNVGFNDGEAAGQTIPHCHIHLIPRRPGDMADPRGGVRGVIPDKQSY